jgi:hypothetical protein
LHPPVDCFSLQCSTTAHLELVKIDQSRPRFADIWTACA